MKARLTILLLSLFVLLIFAGCKKGSNSPAYYFTFQVGGKSYTADSAWAIRNSPFLHDLTIQVRPAQTNVNNGHYIAGNFYASNNSSTDTLFPGTYSCALTTPSKSICGSSLEIYIPTDANSGNYGSAAVGNFTLTVTESNATFVSGNFTGLMGALPIANGKFKVLYKL